MNSNFSCWIDNPDSNLFRRPIKFCRIRPSPYDYLFISEGIESISQTNIWYWVRFFLWKIIKCFKKFEYPSRKLEKKKVTKEKKDRTLITFLFGGNGLWDHGAATQSHGPHGSPTPCEIPWAVVNTYPKLKDSSS